MRFPQWIEALPTPAKLLLLLSAALLPFGVILAWTASDALGDADTITRQNARLDAAMLSEQIEGIVARNAMALRVASNAALATPSADSCRIAQRSLAIVPAVAQDFELESTDGKPICATDRYVAGSLSPIVAPGAIRIWVAADGSSLQLRTGVINGSATTRIALSDLAAIAADYPHFVTATLGDGTRTLPLIVRQNVIDIGTRTQVDRIKIAGKRLELTAISELDEVSAVDKATIFLPLLMWVLAGLLSWMLVHRLLIRPLRGLEKEVSEFAPGDDTTALRERKFGAASEIRDLAASFAEALDRIDEGEKQMGEALEGQRRLVREVHHRVKNNLQVVASLLSIHGRSATGAGARAAYAGIGRRVDALSVVHRNHFAELEESQGIQLRPLLTELAHGLRASVPKGEAGFAIDLDLEPASTTQDTAVAVAFFVTELVEYAMVAEPPVPAEISLRRTSALTARLTVTSEALYEQQDSSADRAQFERIVEAIARQLRSPLERTMGRYSVEIAVFPDR